MSGTSVNVVIKSSASGYESWLEPEERNAFLSEPLQYTSLFIAAPLLHLSRLMSALMQQ